MVVIKKEARRLVYANLFKEGVVVAPKNGYKPTHDEIEGVTNLEVMCLMKSLKSRNFVTESFSWLVHYWYLTNEGIEYLREFLHIPENVVPNTLKKARLPEPQRPVNGGDSRGPRDDFKKGGGAPDGYRPDFGRGGGGFGRGAGGPGGAAGGRGAGRGGGP